MDPTSAALGYGLEYSFSVMERIRYAGLMGDRETPVPDGIRVLQIRGVPARPGNGMRNLDPASTGAPCGKQPGPLHSFLPE